MPKASTVLVDETIRYALGGAGKTGPQIIRAVKKSITVSEADVSGAIARLVRAGRVKMSINLKGVKFSTLKRPSRKKSTKRKATKRKATKRKATKRKATKKKTRR